MATSIISTISVTEAAQASLALTFEGKSRPPLRVYLSFMRDSGPCLDLAPDAPTATDTVREVDGWTIVVNTLLLNQAAPLSIDAGPGGYCIHSALDFSEAGGNCGGACDHEHDS